jgi:hypothetical protein
MSDQPPQTSHRRDQADPRPGKSRPALVPFPRLFALLGYALTALIVAYFVVDWAAQGALVA